MAVAVTASNSKALDPVRAALLNAGGIVTMLLITSTAKKAVMNHGSAKRRHIGAA